MEVIQFLRSWIIDIVIMFVFITALQLMLPNNSMKRYINVITGFLIIFIIINPFVKVLSGNINLEQNYLKRYSDSIYENYYEDESFLSFHNEQMMELYKENLKEKIKETVNKDLEYEIVDINLTVIEDNNAINYGQLTGVSLTVNLDRGREESNIESINIKKVRIDKDRNNNSNDEFKGDEKVKKIISKNYNVPKENIEVFINKQMEGD